MKAEDPTALVTYVNYPSTEYLYLPFLDFICFNVYLESRERLEAYLARLQNIAGDRPLVMAEIGLDSLRNGDERRAQALEWQIDSVFAAGCAGVFVFAWTDEWHRGGHDIDDWKFGLTTIERTAQAGAGRREAGVRRHAFRDGPHRGRGCRWSSARTTGADDPPDARGAEAARVSGLRGDRRGRRIDGRHRRSSGVPGRVTIDGEAAISDGAAAWRTGLSVARNVGLAAATGEIIAYLDDDA